LPQPGIEIERNARSLGLVHTRGSRHDDGGTADVARSTRGGSPAATIATGGGGTSRPRVQPAPVMTGRAQPFRRRHHRRVRRRA
jgi:hypothetical protein